MEEKINYYNMIVSAYYGMMLMDEYPIKEYVLKDINNYLNDYVIKCEYSFDYAQAQSKALSTTKRVKLQDLLYILNKIKASQDLIHLVKEKIRVLLAEENKN